MWDFRNITHINKLLIVRRYIVHSFTIPDVKRVVCEKSRAMTSQHVMNTTRHKRTNKSDIDTALLRTMSMHVLKIPVSLRAIKTRHRDGNMTVDA